MKIIFTKIYPFTCLAFLVLFVAVTFSSRPVKAQRENVWAFNIMEGLDFNLPDTNGYPAYIATNNANYSWLTAGSFLQFHPRASATICDNSGNLMFYTEGSNIWNEQGTVMPNGKNITGLEILPWPGSGPWTDLGPVVASEGVAAIVPMIDSFDKYFVFTITSRMAPEEHMGKLFCSVVDMELNGGMGDVDVSRKGVLIDSVLATKMVAIPGDNCNIWLLVANEQETLFKAYEITGQGINPNPVISIIGVTGMAPQFYPTVYGHLKISPNRRKLARTQMSHYYIGFEQYCVGGIDIFDFDPATGAVSNRLMLDGNYTNLNDHRKAYTSAEFSADNSKVYGTMWDDVAMHFSHISFPHLVAQFDLNNSNPSASKIIVDSSSARDIKRGPDGKIYYGYEVTLNPWWLGTLNSLSAITQPNLAGAACAPQRAVVEGSPNSYAYTGLPISFFPNSVPVLPRDTITNTIWVSRCYKENAIISATDTTGKWYKWNVNYPYDVGNTSATREVYPGIYVVKYITSNPCSYHIDSFIVSKPKPLPVLTVQECMASVQPVEDTLDWAYVWLKGSDTLHAKPYSKNGDAIYDLAPGSYSLYLQNPDGCDTTLTFEIYDPPFLVVSPLDTIIRYGDSIQLQASGMQYYTWSPSGSLSNDTVSNPFARPLHPVTYIVKGISEGGCMDSATIFIDIDYTMPDFVPNAFSPNGDGLNDLFRIENITYQHALEFRVFNRFGQCVFYTMNAKKGWDGTFNNMPCEVGTYHYLIRIAYPDKREKTLKGDVTLIR